MRELRSHSQHPQAVARPGQTTSRRAEPHISDQAPPVRRAPEGARGPGCGAGRRWRGLAGQRANARATHQRPGATGVEGAGGSGGHGRASRSTTPSRRLACGDLAGGRARRRPEHQRRRKQQAQSLILAAPPARTARGRAAAHGHTEQPGPQDSTCGARNTSGAASTTERRSLRTPRSTPGSGRPGGRQGGPAR